MPLLTNLASIIDRYKIAGTMGIYNAHHHLNFIGAGNYAYAYGHPDADDLIIRLSCHPDGWFAYADAVRRARDESAKAPWLVHTPNVLEICVTTCGLYAATVERLYPAVSTFHRTLVRQFTRSYAGKFAPGRYPSHFENSQPHFCEFVTRFGSWIADTHEDNLLMRGDILVVNDPRAFPLTKQEIQDLHHRYII